MSNETQVAPAQFKPILSASEFYSEARFVPQLKVMLGLQDSMNALVFQDWKSRDLAWHRAIYVQCVELMGHMENWKWWKHTQPDADKAVSKLVEIFHFGLSWSIVRFGQPVQSDSLTQAIGLRVRSAVASYRWGVEPTDTVRHKLVDEMVRTAGDQLFSFPAFVHLMAAIGLTFDDLFERFVANKSMSWFQQLNGSKLGTYRGVWAGKQDKEHLQEIMLELRGVEPNRLAGLVLAQLQDRYDRLVKNAPAA
jgi:hypothetical protein